MTLKLKHILERELDANDARRLFEEIEMPLVPVLAYMERNGVRIDPEALRANKTVYRTDAANQAGGVRPCRRGIQHRVAETGGRGPL